MFWVILLFLQLQPFIQPIEKYLNYFNTFLRSGTMKSSKRKTRSDKFPLTLHPTGQYCKKINSKMYYFGSDKKEALQSYLDQAAYLHGSNHNSQKPVNDSMTLKQLCDMFLKYQFSRVKANGIMARHYNKQDWMFLKEPAFTPYAEPRRP